MRANILRLTIIALLAAVVLSGCTWGRRSTTVAPRQQTGGAAMTANVETLRHENAQLRKAQDESRAEVAALRAQLAEMEEEQRRFRQMMTTNFDLLEQSVALTLSKTITADLRQSAPPPAAPRSPAPAAAPVAAAPAPAKSAPSTGAPPASPAPAMAETAATPPGGKAALVPVAQRRPAANPAVPARDPDLTPPGAPVQLSAHREAKPLYERGFALFARKDYAQAIIVFGNFLQRFPDDIYSDNAQFWIAESHRALDQTDEAEAGYRAVLRTYAHRSTLEGYKTPDAMYRLAQMFQQRGDTQRAKQFYDGLVAAFPDTSAGRKATRELAAIGLQTAKR